MFKKLEINTLMLLLGVVLLMVSCGDETKRLDRSTFGFEFFPLEESQYWVYKVEETLIKSEGMQNSTSTFFVREDVTESFVNTIGDTIYKIQRSISDDINGVFVPTDVWTAELTENAAYRVEENLEFVKMIFPFSVGTTWDGNLFDNQTDVIVAENEVKVYKDWGNYEVAAKGIPFSVEGENYTNVTRIDQANFESAIERRYAVEYYATGVGLIQKELEIFDTQCVCEGQTWLQKAEAGFKLTQTLVDHN
jgi:hypothetical protein